MKYIRTKDKILLFRDYEGINGVLTNIGWIYKFEIIKEADTIEDLFDGYVCIVKNYDAEYCTCFIPLKASWESCTEEERKLRKIYGAIWTDKGLIYVAKLNEKGKWELI